MIFQKFQYPKALISIEAEQVAQKFRTGYCNNEPRMCPAFNLGQDRTVIGTVSGL